MRVRDLEDVCLYTIAKEVGNLLGYDVRRIAWDQCSRSPRSTSGSLARRIFVNLILEGGIYTILQSKPHTYLSINFRTLMKTLKRNHKT